MTIKTQVSHQTVTDLYNQIMTLTEKYADSKKVYVDANAEVETHFLKCLADGSVVGSNADKRRADHQNKHASLYIARDKAQDEMDEDKLNLDLARIDEEKLRALLRVDEMLVRVWVAANG